MRKVMKRGVALVAALALLAGCTTASGPDRPPAVDRDGNKIFDDLDALLTQARDDQAIPVIMLMKDQAEIARIAAEDEFEVRHRYTVVPAVAATMSKAQIIQQAKSSSVKHIEHDAEVRALMGTANLWSGAAQARLDFGVTGDMDGNPTGYSKEDVVIAVIDTGKSVTYRT